MSYQVHPSQFIKSSAVICCIDLSVHEHPCKVDSIALKPLKKNIYDIKILIININSVSKNCCSI